MIARIDIHQHLWPEPLLAALARRREPPMLLRRGEGWALRLHGEPEAPVSLADHDPAARAALLAADGVDRALVAPSSPLGIEALPAAEAEPLLAAYHEGVAALGEPFAAWAAVGLDAPDAAGLGRRLDAGFAGACVPAAALAGPEGYDRLGPLLETLERRGAPLFVHPGAAGGNTTATRRAAVDTAAGRPPAADAAAARPVWWPALTDYVAEMHAAWHAFAVWGRPSHPALKVCFAMLAGLAPLQRERLIGRGGRAASDPLVFLDTSSYGARAVDAVLREVGVDQLVHGSDRPVVVPAELALGGEAVHAALRVRNPARLLARAAVELAA